MESKELKDPRLKGLGEHENPEIAGIKQGGQATDRKRRTNEGRAGCVTPAFRWRHKNRKRKGMTSLFIYV